MKIKNAHLKSLLTTTAAALVASSMAIAARADQSEISITRTASSPAALTGNMTKDVFNYVERQVTEDVQVPYEVTVPYEDTETYYETVQRCEDRMEQECRHADPVCRDVPVCSQVTEQICRHTSPTDPTPVCEDRVKERCTTEQKCESTGEVCRDVPRQHCWDEQVARTRTVTRERTETRYRTEQQTRTVTDAVFDHSYAVTAVIKMPADAILQQGESETILISLAGSEAAPSLDVRVDSPIFSYKVINQQRTGRNKVTVTLATAPKYQPEDLAEKTITGLALTNTGGVNTVRFSDAGLVSRTQTAYRVTITDLDTQQVVFEKDAQASFGARDIVIPVTAGLAADHDHSVQLTVRREGVVIAGGAVDFSVSETMTGQLDSAPYKDPNSVRDFAIEGGKLVFTDATPNDKKVDTRYAIQIKGKTFIFTRTLAKGTVNRSDLRETANGRLEVELSQLGSKSIKSGKSVTIEVTVTRQSVRLKDSPIRIKKSAKIKAGK